MLSIHHFIAGVSFATLRQKLQGEVVGEDVHVFLIIEVVLTIADFYSSMWWERLQTLIVSHQATWIFYVENHIY